MKYISVLSKSETNMLKCLLNNAVITVLGDKEYTLYSGDDLDALVDKLLSENNPYEVKGILVRFGVALKEISE